jgi:hypothetical protein
MSIICFDMNQMPSFPLVGDDPVPNMTTYVLEISCLEGMQERSSFAVDARGLYLADWDKGYPDSDAEFDLLHEEYVRWGTWPTVIRPNCEHIPHVRVRLTLRGLYQGLDCTARVDTSHVRVPSAPRPRDADGPNSDPAR